MKRYDFDDEDFQDDNLFPDTDNDGDDDDYDDDVMDSAEYAEMVKRQEALALAHLELAYFELDQQLLLKAVNLARKHTWFFGLRSKETQLNIIAKMYQFLRKLLIEEEKGEKKDA